jgi:hypothetical protein
VVAVATGVVIIRAAVLIRIAIVIDHLSASTGLRKLQSG